MIKHRAKLGDAMFLRKIQIVSTLCDKTDLWNIG